jgi:hypothetical protein
MRNIDPVPDDNERDVEYQPNESIA